MSGDASQGVAAAAAVVAAGVVIWQSWETRKSAEASRAALDTANAALDLTRQQAAEAVRARIDAATPRIGILVPDEPEWPPREPPLYLGDHPQPIDRATAGEMHLPRDRDRQFMVRTPVKLINESDAHVQVEVVSLDDATGAPVASPVFLGPRESFEAYFTVTRTLVDWIAIHTAREQGQPGPQATTELIYSDPADTGAVDNWILTLSGTVVEKVPSIDGGWQLIAAPQHLSGAPGAIGVGPVRRHRRYYLSKTRNQQLPE